MIFFSAAAKREKRMSPNNLQGSILECNLRDKHRVFCIFFLKESKCRVMLFQTAIITPARNVLASQSLKRINYELDRVCQEIGSWLSPDALFFVTLTVQPSLQEVCQWETNLTLAPGNREATWATWTSVAGINFSVCQNDGTLSKNRKAKWWVYHVIIITSLEFSDIVCAVYCTNQSIWEAKYILQLFTTLIRIPNRPLDFDFEALFIHLANLQQKVFPVASSC